MPLTSWRFVIFVTVTLVVYNRVPARYRISVLLLASVLFFAESSVLHLAVLGAVSVITYGAARVIEARRSPVTLAASISLVVLPLVLFKYYGFLAQLAAQLLGLGATATINVALPLGISFFTLQAIAYLVDIYRGVEAAQHRLDTVAMYLAFFPKLVAGPIERARDLLPQLQALVHSTAPNLYTGLKRALWGFFCKLVVADNIGGIVDSALRSLHQESGGTLLIVFALYSFQIYFDFLGYTNIAIGVARCFNVRISANFNVPYGATSLQEFWRRWHISLSTWFRDYVYIPLGGNATRGTRRVGQVMVVFLVSGLWHGAAMHFAAWGAFHGVVYSLEEQFRRRLRGPAQSLQGGFRLLHRGTQRALTFSLVTVGWVFFRLPDLESASVAIQRMAGSHTSVPYGSLNGSLTRADSLWFFLILGSAIFLDSSRRFRPSLDQIPDSPGQVFRELAYVNWLAVTLVLLGGLGVRDFTYASF